MGYVKIACQQSFIMILIVVNYSSVLKVKSDSSELYCFGFKKALCLFFFFDSQHKKF